ncbi:MAG: heavy metal-associated domain-containing protein [Polyangiales bacterium]
MNRYTLKIDGMTCGGCVNAVRNALGSLRGAEVDEVTLGAATVRGDASVTEASLREVVEGAGFELQAVHRDAETPTGA